MTMYLKLYIILLYCLIFSSTIILISAVTMFIYVLNVNSSRLTTVWCFLKHTVSNFNLGIRISTYEYIMSIWGPHLQYIIWTWSESFFLRTTWLQLILLKLKCMKLPGVADTSCTKWKMQWHYHFMSSYFVLTYYFISISICIFFFGQNNDLHFCKFLFEIFFQLFWSKNTQCFSWWNKNIRVQYWVWLNGNEMSIKIYAAVAT